MVLYIRVLPSKDFVSSPLLFAELHRIRLLELAIVPRNDLRNIAGSFRLDLDVVLLRNFLCRLFVVNVD